MVAGIGPAETLERALQLARETMDVSGGMKDFGFCPDGKESAVRTI